MPTTLTTARDDVTRAVANLRALGCKVHTIIGHDPDSGRYHYGVRVPVGVHPMIVGRSLSLAQQARMFTASIGMHPVRDDVVVVTCTAPREVGKRASLRRRIDAAEAVACALNHVAARIEAFDRKGSASRQHFIETGLYLTREQGYSISIDPEPAKVTIELTPEQVGGLRDLVNEYDNGGVSLELAEMLAESVREILPSRS